ncbi:Gon7-domain-containing protein [Xylona heveae TC161]|uniref:EKC/KEOPS complex subunit GON7 n=1 Tax=Xylona heveae (strain CBS 132557 / TC161) TaxID=1328760 RepID=A0A165A2Y3_XYLHT|nr:Gon7-domain-containing protein [Xylona heveae TC161]KZF19881.1 Gon7-domain-containing protein [Xylona heveae TC161]
MSTISAEYTSPEGNKTLSIPLTAALPRSPSSTQEKISYLSDLRSSVPKLQDEVNAFLTQQMEEDNKRAATGAAGNKRKIDEAKEEENYGEESGGSTTSAEIDNDAKEGNYGEDTVYEMLSKPQCWNL